MLSENFAQTVIVYYKLLVRATRVLTTHSLVFKAYSFSNDMPIAVVPNLGSTDGSRGSTRSQSLYYGQWEVVHIMFNICYRGSTVENVWESLAYCI